MVIIKLMGGLGNQMFQYAIGRSLSIKNNSDLILDVSFFENQSGITERKFELFVFNIKAEVLSIPEIKKIKKKYFENSIQNKIMFFFNPGREGVIYNETNFNFDPDVFKLNNNLYINGYFQSEKYFENITSGIKDDFEFKEALDESKKEIIDRIKGSNSVSIHIRRGDYLTNAQAVNVLGLCTIDYYKKAIRYINNYVKIPHFFVFSDDIDWAKINLNIDAYAEFVSNNDLNKNHEDMRLMSLCKHNIIANSSFSWWGAWLNSNSEKIVIAPKKWFNDSSFNTRDLIPQSWIKL